MNHVSTYRMILRESLKTVSPYSNRNIYLDTVANVLNHRIKTN